MTDVFSKTERSRIMSLIRSKDTKIELLLCKMVSKNLYHLGYRYRKNYSKIPGCPDLAFVSKKVAVFVDGDFWHGYKFSLATTKLRSNYWKNKIISNMARDKHVIHELKKMGWVSIRVWEHDIKKNPNKVLAKVSRAILSR